jgi:hypothetical protein
MRNISQRATQFSQAVQAAPQQAAQLRQSVLAAAGQLNELRDEVQACFTGVNVDTQERLGQVVTEINENIGVIESAGYELVSADIEIMPLRRVILRLDRFEQVGVAAIRALAPANATRTTIQALLAAMVKAEELSEKMEFPGLEYRGIAVHLGSISTVRICWNYPEEETNQAATPPVIGVQTQSAPAVPSPSLPTFGSGGFFQPRVSNTQTAGISASIQTPTAPVAPAEPAQQAPAATPASPEHAGADWRQNALDRFKQMPTGSKYKSHGWGR